MNFTNNPRFQAVAPYVAVIVLVALGLGLIIVTMNSEFGPTFGAATSRTGYDSADPLVTKIDSTSPTKPTITGQEPMMGNPSANIKLVIFSDFSCPYCATLSSTIKQVLADKPEIAVVWKHFPLTALHPDSRAAHQAAFCAGEQGKFWEFHDQLFAQKTTFTREYLLRVAQDLRLKPSQFAACLESSSANAAVANDIAEGNALGIDGTPYLFINDQRISGAISADELKRAIEIHELVK